MLAFLFRRIVETLIVIFIVTLISFSLLHMIPGDAAVTMLGTEASIDEINALRRELWLDRSFFVQYGHWLSNALRGDLGESVAYRDPVVELFAKRLPITCYLAFWAFIFSTATGISAGVYCAVRRGSMLDQLVILCANVGFAIPIFWLGILSIYFFGLRLNWLPIQGYVSPFDGILSSTRHAILPVILLAIPSIAVMARQTRSSMLEVVAQDYMRSAFAKGLSEKTVVFKHGLKNALIPVVTLLGLQVRLLVGGSVLLESIFNIPGMGRLLVNAAFNKDFLIVQGGVLLIGMVVCMANLMVDLSYGWLDPRIRY